MATEQDGKTPESVPAGENNLAAAQPVPETPKRDLGQYESATDKLTQEQMLGIGGGSEFFELIDCDGSAIKHIAMPALLRDRPMITAALKQHAQTMMDMHGIIEGKGEFKKLTLDEQTKRLEELEERDLNCLLTVAFYCFKRSDPSLKNKTEKEGIGIILNWIDTSQLQDIPRIAMGLNKLSPLRMGGSALAMPSL